MSSRSASGAADFMNGALKGIISKIDARAEDEQEKIKLQRDLLSYAVKQKYRIKKETQARKERDQNTSDIFNQMTGGMGNQSFIKETPMTGMAGLFGYDNAGNRTNKQEPYAMTEETESGERRPMVSQDVDLEAVSRAQQPTMSSAGIGVRPMPVSDKMLKVYNALKAIEDSGRPLNPQQQKMKNGIEIKMGWAEKEKGPSSATRTGIDKVYEAINKGSVKTRAEALDFFSQAEPYYKSIGADTEAIKASIMEMLPEESQEPQKQSLITNITQFLANRPEIKSTSQAVQYIVQLYKVSQEQAIEMLKSAMGQENAA